MMSSSESSRPTVRFVGSPPAVERSWHPMGISSAPGLATNRLRGPGCLDARPHGARSAGAPEVIAAVLANRVSHGPGQYPDECSRDQSRRGELSHQTGWRRRTACRHSCCRGTVRTATTRRAEGGRAPGADGEADGTRVAGLAALHSGQAQQSRRQLAAKQARSEIRSSSSGCFQWRKRPTHDSKANLIVRVAKNRSSGHLSQTCQRGFVLKRNPL